MSKRSILWGVIALLLVVVVVGATVGAVFYREVERTGVFDCPSTTRLIVNEETTMEDITEQLYTKGKAKELWAFGYLSQLFFSPSSPLYRRIHVGAYMLSSEMSLMDLVNNLRRQQQAPVRITFNNIRTLSQFTERIAHQLPIPQDTLDNILSDTAYITSMGFSPETLLALFIPNTYEVYYTISPRQFIKRMHREYNVFWTEQRRAKAERLGLTPHEVVTLASIVSEETRAKGEYSIVAGLYLNRIKRGMPLQADPTVKFAVGDFSLRRILHKHLEVESPYNTYRNRGLPPGPICFPSPQVLDATLNAAQHNYIYMCARETFDGQHNFASSYSQHLHNARRYSRALNERNIK